MAHPLVEQLRFARSEFRRCLEGVSEEDAVRRLLPMNSLGWIICHLAGQERRFWLIWAQGITDVAPELNEWGHFDKPANTPPLEGAWAAWDTVTHAVDPFLEALTQERLVEHLVVDGEPMESNIGTMLRRSTYLLVPQRRGERHPATPGAPECAGVRRGDRQGGALPPGGMTHTGAHRR